MLLLLMIQLVISNDSQAKNELSLKMEMLPVYLCFSFERWRLNAVLGLNGLQQSLGYEINVLMSLKMEWICNANNNK